MYFCYFFRRESTKFIFLAPDGVKIISVCFLTSTVIPSIESIIFTKDPKSIDVEFEIGRPVTPVKASLSEGSAFILWPENQKSRGKEIKLAFCQLHLYGQQL